MELTEAEDDFLWFARSGELEELQQVFAENAGGFNVNCRDPVSGNTALHMACANGHGAAVEFLLNTCGVDQSIVNLKGSTPLHWAVGVLEEGKDVEICKILLAGPKCDVLFKNAQGKGCTSLAIQKGNVDLVKILLEHASASELEPPGGGEEVEEDEGEEEEERTLPEPKQAKQQQQQDAASNVQTMDSLYTIVGDTSFTIREMGIRPTTLEELAGGEGDAIHQTHFTVWAAAIILARWVAKELNNNKQLLSVLELGAGTGLSGVAVHRLCPVQRVLLTDLKIESHLQFNADTAKQRFAKAMRKRKKKTAVPPLDTWALDWTKPETLPQDWLKQTDVLVGSDLVYDLELVEPLVATCNALLKRGGTFYYVSAVTNRAGMDRFLAALKRTFSLEEVRAPTPDMLVNPLGEEKRALFDLHLSDLTQVEHLMYRFRKL